MRIHVLPVVFSVPEYDLQHVFDAFRESLLLFYPSAENCTHFGCKCVQFQVLYCTKGKIVLISGANAYSFAYALLNSKTGSFCWIFAKTIVAFGKDFCKTRSFCQNFAESGVVLAKIQHCGIAGARKKLPDNHTGSFCVLLITFS